MVVTHYRGRGPVFWGILTCSCFLHLGQSVRKENPSPGRGAFFILQLHDELLYEVAEDDVIQVLLHYMPPHMCMAPGALMVKRPHMILLYPTLFLGGGEFAQ